MYYLYQADFLRVLDLTNVRTIAILGTSCAQMGEFNLYCSLWACGVRLIQGLGLDTDAGLEQIQSIKERQQIRCLYWTFVASDWLTFQIRSPTISGSAVSVSLPANPAGEEQLSRSESGAGISDTDRRNIQYHITLARICSAMYSFKWTLSALSGDTEELASIVQRADNNLADIISDLPQVFCASEHLSMQESDTEQLKWQQKSISVILLYYRMVVNRVLRLNTPRASPYFAGATAICFEAAHGIVDLLIEVETESSRHYLW